MARNLRSRIADINNHRPKVHIFASEIEESTVAQAQDTAKLPFVYPHVTAVDGSEIRGDEEVRGCLRGGVEEG